MSRPCGRERLYCPDQGLLPESHSPGLVYTAGIAPRLCAGRENRWAAVEQVGPLSRHPSTTRGESGPADCVAGRCRTGPIAGIAAAGCTIRHSETQARFPMRRSTAQRAHVSLRRTVTPPPTHRSPATSLRMHSLGKSDTVTVTRALIAPPATCHHPGPAFNGDIHLHASFITKVKARQGDIVPAGLAPGFLGHEGFQQLSPICSWGS